MKYQSIAWSVSTFVRQAKSRDLVHVDDRYEDSLNSDATIEASKEYEVSNVNQCTVHTIILSASNLSITFSQFSLTYINVLLEV